MRCLIPSLNCGLLHIELQSKPIGCETLLSVVVDDTDCVISIR